MDHFTPEQFERYEAYRRSTFQKTSVRKVKDDFSYAIVPLTN